MTLTAVTTSIFHDGVKQNRLLTKKKGNNVELIIEYYEDLSGKNMEKILMNNLKSGKNYPSVFYRRFFFRLQPLVF